jgi:hypothetical protein
MKRITLTFVLIAALMTACTQVQTRVQIKELEPENIVEILTAQQLGAAYDANDDYEDEDGYDGPQDCYPVTKITATSRHAAPDYGIVNYDEKNLYDEDYHTSWMEGVKGYGSGEKITFTLKDVTADFNGIEIANGDYASEDSWQNYSRIKKMKLSFNDKPMFILNLKNEMGNQIFRWDKPLNEKDGNLVSEFTVTLEIMEVYQGDLYDDTVISEVLFLDCY